MATLLIAFGAFVGYLIAYHTYGRWLARKVFTLDPDAPVPSTQLRDDKDYVPTRREVVFGHHFTSIAGTGPIVGPAIAVFWGWLPALIWVLVGSILIGAVHDFGAMVVSLRNRGQTIGEIAGRMIHPRARVLFLLILFFALMIVIGIFGLVIAIIFALYPESVLSVWIEIPVAVLIGLWVYKRGGGLLGASIGALAVMYGFMVVGAYLLPIDLTALLGVPLMKPGTLASAVVIWTGVLLVYCFVASILPVWVLLQPRDFINSHQLILALVLVVGGLAVAGATGQADLFGSAPAVSRNVPADAPPIWPFLFITIACGACSGFHCLVSSGTSSKQLQCETDAQSVGYGSMLLEGGLAVIVILACCAGLGMGKYDRIKTDGPISGVQVASYQPVVNADTGQAVTGRAAWLSLYNPGTKWADFKLPNKIKGFIEGGANFLSSIGIPIKLGIAIIAVLVASFAATTLDTATRLQRYVIQELGKSTRIKPLQGKVTATAVAVVTGGAVALTPGPAGPGSGGLILWPLFGATNQLLAGLAFMVIVFYLWRRSKPVLFALVPMLIMLLLPGWAMLHQVVFDFAPNGKWLLLGFGLLITVLQVWLMIEALLMWPRARGVLEDAPPPLEGRAAPQGARSC